MRILVSLLLDTLPMLGNVLLLCFFLFFIFGIVGVQLWAGLLRQRCFLTPHYQSQLLDTPGYRELVMFTSRPLYTRSPMQCSQSLLPPRPGLASP